MALLNSEKFDDFQWALETFRKFFTVKDYPPSMIITDEDPALAKAIECEFPNAVHQICSWHKQQNLKKHFVILFQ